MPFHSFRLIVVLLIISAMALGACAPSVTPTEPASGSNPVPPVSSSESSAGDAAASNSNPQAGQPDAVSGLPQPSLAPRPSNSNASAPMQAQTGRAVLAIGGELPLFLTGGECQPFEGDLYLNIPNIAGALPPYANLVIFAGDGLTRSGQLIWATSAEATDSATVSAQDIFTITLNEDGFSGSFQGTAQRITNSIPIQQTIQVTGVFTCVASLITVRGPHPVDLDGAQCETAPQFVMRAGSRGQNQVLLMLEPGSAPGDNDIPAGISWHVGGVTYTSNWLIANRNPDGLSGSYYGEAIGPDGIPFEVQGTFNCLGG